MSTTSDSRPRVRYRLPSGEIVRIIFDHDEPPLASRVDATAATPELPGRLNTIDLPHTDWSLLR